MASFNRVTFGGSSDTISVPFPYLDKTHVKVYLNDVLVSPSAYTWPSGGQVKITAGNPVAGVLGEVRRRTPTTVITSFSPGNLDVTDLNVGVLQPLFLAEEARDIGDDVRARAWYTAALANGGLITKGVAGQVAVFDASGNLVPSSGGEGDSLLGSMLKMVYDPNGQNKKALFDQRKRFPFSPTLDKTRYTTIANLIRATGDATYTELYGTNREIQSATYSPYAKAFFTVHDNDGDTQFIPARANLTIMTRYPVVDGTVDFTEDAHSTPTTLLPHQCIAADPYSDWFFGTDATNKLAMMRFKFVANGLPALIEQYILFDSAVDGINWNTDVSCFDSISPRFIIAHGKIVGQDTVIFRYFDRDALLARGPGNHAGKQAYQHEDFGLYSPSVFPVQGATSPDDRMLVAFAGGNGFAVDPPRCATYDIETGVLLELESNFNVGSAEALQDGSGISWEPEGAFSMMIDGVMRLIFGFRSGSSLNPSTFRLYAVGTQPKADFTVRASGPIAWFRRIGQLVGGIELNTTAIKHMAYGVGVNIRLGTNGVDDWEVAQSNRAWRPMVDASQQIGQGSRRLLSIWSLAVQFATNNLMEFVGVVPTGSRSAGSIAVVQDGGRSALQVKTTGTEASPTTGGYVPVLPLVGTTTWDPPSTAVQSLSASTTVTITGAVLGDMVQASFSNSLQGCDLVAYVSAADTITVLLYNGSASTKDLASGTLKVMLWK